jgi:hypothetical protein
MAYFRKSFNFRNGVQVDSENFVVNANGLVGIGTTIPTELLDVRGDVLIQGTLTTNEIVSSSVNADETNVNKINIGIVSISSGIIEASSGIVTYYGDGGNLINLPTSQWIDVDSGLGYTSIYAAGNVGVGTTFPNFSFQVGGDPNFSGGLGISSDGNIYSSGIITAVTFDGNGSSIQNINANNISFGVLDIDRLPIIPNEKLPSNISISGIVTAQSGFNGNLTGNVNSPGLSTFSGGIQGNLTGNVNSPGLSTFSGGIQGNLTGNVTGNLTGNVIGIASTAINLVSNARIDISHTKTQTFESGISTISTRLKVSGKIGINTDSSQSDLHIVNESDGKIQITSNESFVIIGKSLNPNENSGGLKYGNTFGIYPYSTDQSLDIINTGNGNINYYLDYGITGSQTGTFNWIYGPDSASPLMSLTYDGKLGIGITNPTERLEVLGNANVVSLQVDENIVAVGAGSSLTINDVYILNGKLGVYDGSGNQILLEDNEENLNVSSGVSTFFDIQVSNYGIFNRAIGIGNTDPQGEIHIGDYVNDIDNSIIITTTGIGLGTDFSDSEFFLDGLYKTAGFGAIAIGSTEDKIKVGGPAVLYVNGNSEFNGIVTATSYIGSGENLTNLNASNLSSGTVPGIRGVTSGSTSQSFVRYNGTTSLAGAFYGGTTQPSQTTRLNYDGNLHTNSLDSNFISSGIVTATSGFTSGIGTAVQITTVGNQLVFTVPGVGTTSLTLF